MPLTVRASRAISSLLSGTASLRWRLRPSLMASTSSINPRTGLSALPESQYARSTASRITSGDTASMARASTRGSNDPTIGAATSSAPISWPAVRTGVTT